MKAHPDVLKQAIADALGVPITEVNLDDILETDKGLVVKVKHPDDKEIPSDFAKNVTEALKKHPIFANAEVSEPGI